MGKLGAFARVMLFAGFGMFLVGATVGFAGLFLQWGDLALIASGPLIGGGVMAFAGVATTVLSESRRNREGSVSARASRPSR